MASRLSYRTDKPHKSPTNHHTTKPTLNDLPEELLEQIVKLLNTYDARRETCDGTKREQSAVANAYNFCLVSRKFYRIGRKFLYSIFVNDNDPKSLQKFLSRSVRAPELLTSLRTIIIGEFKGISDSDEHCEDEKELRDAALERVQRFDIFRERERDAWVQSVGRRDYEAQIALLLALSPNLETIDLTYGNFGFYFSWCQRLISWAIQHPLPEGQLGPFSSLRHFIFRESPLMTYPGDYRFWEVVMLSSIQKLELHHLSETREGYPCWIEKISNTKALVFRPRSHTSRLFEPVLRACRELKSVTYILDNLEPAERSFDVASIFHLHALRIHEKSLTDLVLECNIPHDILPAMPPMPTLKDFTRLKRLHISGIFFVPNIEGRGGVGRPASADASTHSTGAAAHFPSSLEYLVLECVSVDQSYWHDFVVLLLSIKELRDTYFRHLHTVEIIVPSLLWEGTHDNPKLTAPLSSITSAMVECTEMADVRVHVAHKMPWQGNCTTYHFTKDP